MNLLTSLRYLVALEAHRHFGRAAQACHITQPALSNALRALEAEFGVVIVKRGRLYAGLTHEGEAVLQTAHRMLHEHEVLQQQLQSELGRPRGKLRMAAVPTALPMLTRFAVRLQALHPGITQAVLSMSSQGLEAGLEDLSLDLALGYTERMPQRGLGLTAWPQCTEHYYLVRRRSGPTQPRLSIGQPMRWAEAAALPLCLLTPEMHNRTIVDQAFARAGAVVRPAIETNSVMALAMALVQGQLSAVLPGAMVDAIRSQGQLEALPLVQPEVLTPIGFMTLTASSPSRTLEAALQLAQQPAWLGELAQHSGALLDQAKPA